ncbi:hypothetical protein HOLleu_04817 [Holothuria leucospilota]|uniref:Uncharacterized protein n=1 Tax=Holothuria leucospilota TaxID=206669 RepID=A0A9Q1CK37_HOLLE|nr:hypothetical protein HOLleu_04817 [Holothuria leucospilota]
MKKKINEGKKREKEKGRGRGKGKKGEKEKKRKITGEKGNKIITIGIIIDGRIGWREGNGLDKVEHWFKYRRDEYTDTGRARDSGKDQRE